MLWELFCAMCLFEKRVRRLGFSKCYILDMPSSIHRLLSSFLFTGLSFLGFPLRSPFFPAGQVSIFVTP